MTQTLTDAQRRQLHDLALNARRLLSQEARDVLQATFGLAADGTMPPADQLPALARDAEARALHAELAELLEDEARAGLPRPEAVDKLVKEIAFTHLNRLAAFRMMEARGLIRGAVDKGTDSNGFKVWLVEHPEALAAHERGETGDAYRRFLLWQAGQVSRELAVLFDPAAPAGRVFPRPRALADLLALLNDPALAPAWQVEETIGWIYQFFNEPELQAAFAKVREDKAKFEAKDIPAATQLFTPDWVVRFLVQNTLGRLWVEMHPDTRLLGAPLLDYLVPLQGERPPEPLRPVGEITLLDPACGSMHFGLVAFDLFAAMYAEELERAGEAGWPAAPSVGDAAEIPAAILARNLYGIDIDLRAVQLSALALWLRAKRLDRRAVLREANLACADVLPLDGGRLEPFLSEMGFSPLTGGLIRELWGQLRDANQLGSLLRLERALGEAVAQAQRDYAKQPLLARMDAGFESGTGEEFWQVLEDQVEQGLDEFVRAHGTEARFFAGEAHKSVRLLDVMRRQYDVVVTNPPYLSRRKMNDRLSRLVEARYPATKSDFYAAFTERCLEFAKPQGRVGMLTMHSFMFISTYEAARDLFLGTASIQTLAHFGPALFEVGNPGTLQTVAFVLRKDADRASRQSQKGTFMRLVHASNGDAKRRALEVALSGRANVYHVAQERFDAIPGRPWVYWVSDQVRSLFMSLPPLKEVAPAKHGRFTGDNFRFVRHAWEIPFTRVDRDCARGIPCENHRVWVPYMKGGLKVRKWFGNLTNVTKWQHDGREQKSFPGSGERNPECYFREGISYSYLTSGSFGVRYLPEGYLCDVAGSSLYPLYNGHIWTVMGLMNSSWARYALRLLNPTVNFQVGDLERVPTYRNESSTIDHAAQQALRLSMMMDSTDETTIDHQLPANWPSEVDVLSVIATRLEVIERQIDDEVYRLYNISAEDRALIEAELSAGSAGAEEGEDAVDDEEDEAAGGSQPSAVSPEELAVRWISYAVGVVLGRFAPGEPKALGRAVYRRDDFAVGSLPAPDEAEFDRLVGPPERFAWVDADGGRHVFSAEVEAALRAMALPDGIAVLDPGHARDLPALVERALELMLGEAGAVDVIRQGAAGDLRRFLSREYFTGWHLKWYRKRPVYWPLQSAARSYGFVVFHERVGRDFLYVLLREFIDRKQRALELGIADERARAGRSAGAAKKAAERAVAGLNEQLAEVTDFAATIKRLADEGYRPAENWIDDGVILRLAPIHELIPLWKAEPKKHWERLAKGDFDWSHIAMAYWPARVREKCQTNKSFAIAHGLA